MKIPSVQKAVAARMGRRSVKKEPLGEQPDSTDDSPIIVEQDIKPLLIKDGGQSSPGPKKLQVNIETLTLQPANLVCKISDDEPEKKEIPIVSKSHTPTARRGVGWKRKGQSRQEWTGRTDNKPVTDILYDELDAARSLVGLGGDQPKSGNIRNLHTKDKENTESTPSTEVDTSNRKATTRDNVVSTSTDTVVSTSPENVKEDLIYTAKVRAEVEQLLREGKNDVYTQSKVDMLKGILQLLTKPGSKTENIREIYEQAKNTNKTEQKEEDLDDSIDIKIIKDEGTKDILDTSDGDNLKGHAENADKSGIKVIETKKTCSDSIVIADKASDDSGEKVKEQSDEGGGEVSKESDEGGGEVSKESDEGGGEVSKESDEGGGEVTKESDEGGGEVSKESDEGGGEVSKESDEGGGEVSKESDEGGGEVLKESDEGGGGNIKCADVPVKVNVEMSTAAESEILCVENKTDTENTVLYDLRLSVDDCEKEKTEKRNVTFKDEVNEYIDVSPDVKLDDTLSVNDLFIDESVGSETLGSDVKGGDIPLEDQEEFQSTPPCSQIPRVDPYAKQRYSYRYLILHIL